MSNQTIKILNVVKAGTTENILRVPQVRVREDGTLWGANNSMPMLNVSGCELNKEALTELVRSQSWDKIPAGAYFRLGLNVGGKEALTQEQVDARYRDQMTPEDKARVTTAKERAKLARNWDNLHNEGGEGYNPYRDSYEAPDRTPWQKGDDYAE